MSEKTSEAAQGSHPHRWAMLAGVWMCYFCFSATTAAIAPLVDRITRELNLTHAEMGTILGAWQFVYIGAAIPCGAVLDRLGPRRGMLLGASIIAFSSLLRGIATNYPTMLLAVGAFGIGGPMVSVGAPTVIRQWFVGRERGIAIGLYNIGMALGTITGPEAGLAASPSARNCKPNWTPGSKKAVRASKGICSGAGSFLKVSVTSK